MSVFANIIPGQIISNEISGLKADSCELSFEAEGVALLASLFLPVNAPDGARPLCGHIIKDGKYIWDFKSESFVGRVHLIDVCGTPTLAFINSAEIVERVISLPVLANNGSLGSKASAQLKLGAAEVLGIDCEFTELERKLAAQAQLERAKAMKQELAERRAADVAAREARREERERRRQAIVAREQLALVDHNGKPLYGIPVVADEWQCLSDGTWVVLVESYDSSTGNCGALVEHYVVDKRKGSNPKKGSVTTDLRFKQKKIIEPPKPVRTIALEYDGDVHELPVYDQEGLETIKQLRILTTFAAMQKGSWVVVKSIVDGTTVKFGKVADASVFSMA